MSSKFQNYEAKMFKQYIDTIVDIKNSSRKKGLLDIQLDPGLHNHGAGINNINTNCNPM